MDEHTSTLMSLYIDVEQLQGQVITTTAANGVLV